MTKIRNGKASTLRRKKELIIEQTLHKRGNTKHYCFPQSRASAVPQSCEAKLKCQIIQVTSLLCYFKQQFNMRPSRQRVKCCVSTC